jgi:hypothetical protein
MCSECLCAADSEDASKAPTTISPYGAAGFVAVFVMAMLLLLQDNIPLAYAANYAVILMLYRWFECC